MGDAGIGQYEHIVSKREAVTSRMSPVAKHQAFPTLYARPLPREATVIADPTPPLKAEIASLKAEVAELKAENARLHRTVESLGQRAGNSRNIKIEDVQTAFIDAMAANAYRLDEQPYGLQHLRSHRRARSYSDPRLVCVWLVRAICVQHSYPVIARAFGNRDHTSAIHSCKRGPQIAKANPLLRNVARSVLAAFNVALQVEEGP